jgi:hypothetical protein
MYNQQARHADSALVMLIMLMKSSHFLGWVSCRVNPRALPSIKTCVEYYFLFVFLKENQINLWGILTCNSGHSVFFEMPQGEEKEKYAQRDALQLG